MIKIKSILTKSKDWSSFKRTVDTLDNKAKGDAFEDLTQHFFRKFYEKTRSLFIAAKPREKNKGFRYWLR